MSEIVTDRDDADLPFCVIHAPEQPNGPGWYWHDREYPEEGVCGPFATREECAEDARRVYADEENPWQDEGGG